MLVCYKEQGWGKKKVSWFRTGVDFKRVRVQVPRVTYLSYKFLSSFYLFHLLYLNIVINFIKNLMCIFDQMVINIRGNYKSVSTFVHIPLRLILPRLLTLNDAEARVAT